MAVIVGTNSYGSVAEADAYFADSLKKPLWDNFTPTTKGQALVEVTRILERQTYSGEKETPTQALAFGRTGIKDCEGVDLTPAESLEAFKPVQFEYALEVASNPSLINSTSTADNIQRIKSNSTDVSFFFKGKGSRFPSSVQEMLACFLNRSVGIAGSFASGVSDESSFTEEPYSRSREFR